MKGMYTALVILTIIIITMLCLAFFYLDQQKHQTFLYAIFYNDVLTGYEKVDKYLLENSVIYKSSVELPRDISARIAMRKITFGRRGKRFIAYTKETSIDEAKNVIHIEDGPKGTSFMATGHATFAYLEKVPNPGNFVVFEAKATATYPSLIRRYNFKKRGEQFVNILTPLSDFLPPVGGKISITSIGKDTIEIEGRNIKCEQLVLELESGNLISVWVGRTFQNVLMVEIPKYGFKAVLCTEKMVIPVEEYKRESTLYSEKEVAFNNMEIKLSGTLSVPNVGESPYPTILLIWDSGPLDRNSFGMFTDIAHFLAEEGYCVLRFDKRGIGKSQGFFSTYAQSEEIADLRSAIDFLKSLPDVDKSRIAVVGHSEGGFYATYLASTDENIRACVILSAISSMSPVKNDFMKLKKFVEKLVPDNSQYLESAIETIKHSREIIKDKGDWITISGKRVFTRKIKLEDNYDPLEAIKKVRVPVLILRGKKDGINFQEEVMALGDTLASSSNEDFTIIYFGELNHSFGVLVRDPRIRDHIEVDIEVLKNIPSWLDENLSPPPATEGEGQGSMPRAESRGAESSRTKPTEESMPQAESWGPEEEAFPKGEEVEEVSSRLPNLP